MSRALTNDEVRDRFLDHVAAMVRYWEREARAPTVRDKVEGVAFSILAALDGSAMALPAFVVAPSPHPEDEAYHRERGEDFYPLAESEHDIAGELHSALLKKLKEAP